MKSLFIFIFISLTFYTAQAQVKAFAPLSCFTWGPDQFLDFETVRHNAETDVQGNYNSFQSGPSESSYNAFGQDRGVYAWICDTERYSYINNIQVIRWNFVNQKTPYEIIVKDVFDNVLYSVSTENSCGVIIFPDSIETADNFVFVGIRNSEHHFDLSMINFSLFTLHPRDKAERLSTLKELQACSSLACKIEKLKAHKATLDMLSLLELEKMKDPQHKTADKLYWEIVSQIRYDFANRSWER